jgi:hypothetical protein
MLYLGQTQLPRTAEALHEAITRTMRTVLRLPPEKQPVAIEGAFPALAALRINLDEAQLQTDAPPPQPKDITPQGEALSADLLEVRGHPVRYENAAVHLDLSARQVRFAEGVGRSGERWLLVQSATDGRAEVKVDHASLEALLRAGAAEAAQKQGVRITDVKLELTSRGPRSADVDARITAAKFMVRSVIRIRGRVDIDDQLNAQLSELSCDGQGMIGGIACSFIRPHLERMNGRSVPLMAVSLGEVRLHDVQVDLSNGLHILARFGQ